MSETLTTKGYLLEGDLAGCTGAPSAERRAKGPVAVMECVQNIPCNPCETSCKQGAIAVGDEITDTPRLDGEACSGCAVCVSVCPGQAVFVVDESFSEDEATVALPYEFEPLPAKGEAVTALDRSGAELGPARIVRVTNTKRQDKTAVVTMAVPKAWSMTARFFKRKES